MKNLFTLESLKPVASILDEKDILFVANGQHLETVDKTNDQYIIQFLGVNPVELEVTEEATA